MTIADRSKRSETRPSPAALIPDRPAADGSPPHDRAGLVQATAEARTALEQAALAATIAAQRARSVATVLDAALAVLAEREGAPAVGSPGNGRWPPTVVLSPREREVLTLVVEGRTNKAIAEALFVSPNTVKTHVASLLHKLHADTRTQLAAIAARSELPLGHDADGLRLHCDGNAQSAGPFLRS